MSDSMKRLEELISLMFQAHPWHGIPAGKDAPSDVTAYIEIAPADTVKYELDKPSGHLRIDRPQRLSSLCPTLYGFIPQTFCAEKVAERCMERTGLTGIKGDGDPIDICVLTEKDFSHGNFILRAHPIGGLRMVDANDADDKIIAVLSDDVVYGNITDISQLPPGLVDRLRHYFLTYKQFPSEQPRRVSIEEVYGRDEALEAIRRAQLDYRAHYGAPEDRVGELKRLLAS